VTGAVAVSGDELNERFRASVETLLDCFGMFTAVRDGPGAIVDFRIDYLNAAACRSNGRSCEEQVGRKLLELLPGYRESGLFDAYREVVETGVPLHREMQACEDDLPDGRRSRWFDIKATKSGDGFVAAWRDVTEQRRETVALRWHEGLFRCLADSNVVGIGVGNSRGEVLLVNDEMLRMMGHSRADFEAGRVDWARCLSRASLAEAHANMTELRRRGRTSGYEHEFQRPDGERTPFLGAAALMPDGDTHVSVALDLTARRAAETARAESDARLRLAVRASGTGIWDWDVVTGEVTWSDEVYAIHGLAKGGFAGTTEAFRQLVHPDDLERVWTTVNRAIAERSPYGAEFRIVRPDGNVRWVLTSGQAFYDGEGRPARMLGTIIDVTDRKRVEDALRRSDERLRLAKDAGRLGIHDYDVRSGRIHWDEYVRELWGVAPDEPVTYDTFVAGVHPDDRATIQAAVDRAFDPTTDGRYAATYRVVSRANGRQRWIEATGQVAFAEGRAVRLVGTVVDVTEAKRAEEALRRNAETFAALVEQSPLGIYTVDSRFRLRNVSAGARPAFRNVQPLIGRDFAEVMRIVWPEPFASEAISIFRHTLKTGEPYVSPGLTEKRNDTGVIESYEWQVNRVTLADGQYGVVCYFFDSTILQQANLSLRESEERFRALISATSDVVFRMSPDWTEMRHLEGREFIPDTREPSRTWLETYIPPDDRPQFMAAIRCAIDAKSVFELEHRVIRGDGTVGWTASRAIPMLDANGAILEWFGAARDITEGKEGERALRASEQKYRRLVESLRDAFVVVDMDGSIQDWNAAYREMLGYTDAELRELTYVDLTPPRWHAMEAHIVAEEVLPNDSSGVYEKEYRRKDGSVFPVELRTHLLRDEAGQPQQMWAIVRDISARKQAEAALRESEDRFRTLAENMSQFAWMADDEGWIYWYNRRWYDYTGTTLDEMQGWGWTKVHHPDHVERVVDSVRRAWETGDPWEDSFPLRGRDGEYRWFLARAVPIRDETGTIVRWFGTNTDITVQRAAEEALREADRRKDEFLATLAHELRNPLAPIRQAAGIGLKPMATPAQVRWSLEIIERQVKHMALLLDDLLDVSRVTRGRLKLNRTRLTAREIVQAAVESARPHIDGRSHALEIVVPEDPLPLEGDPLRLAQAMSNLLTNAAKYTEPGGRIVISARRDGEWIELVVEDDGIGIAPDQLEQVFEMFGQGAAPRHLTAGGLGIGLALSRALVTLHGGSLVARSAGIGQGAQFAVRLPAMHESRAAATASAARRLDGVPARRVLVVDDNVDAAESLAMLLRIDGHDVRTAHDGDAALREVEAFRPDVVLLDLGLPGMDGCETARRVRAGSGGEQVLLVAVTGWGQAEDRQRTRAAGFDHHLVKPLDAESLPLILATLPRAPLGVCARSDPAADRGAKGG
jgi:PAS domain S-box-containing protein